jgi:polar amino acid transport system ATP-binding protein
VAGARALTIAARVMFCSEATSALNPELVKGVLPLIANLAAGALTERPQGFLSQVL